MSEDQKSISEWALSIFGDASSNARVAARANEEMAELLRALTIDDDGPSAAYEAADVVIVLYRLMDRMGLDLMQAVDRKMALNRARTWELDSKGNGYHHGKERTS